MTRTNESIQHVVARGKAILAGEHAVVHGRPALVVALDRRLTLRLVRADIAEPEPVARAREALQAVLGLDPALRIEIVQLDLPSGAGLGSSAALAVAAARAVLGPDADRLQIWRAAQIVERLFHGNPSGVDAAAVTWGGALLFRAGDPPEVRPLAAAPLELAVLLTPGRRRTADAIALVTGRLRMERPRVEAIFDRLGELAERGAEALSAGDLASLGLAMNQAHGLLAELGVSTSDLEIAVGVARAAGALGAKLTGAGLGGAAVAVCPPGQAARVEQAAQAAGFEAFVARAGEP